MLNIAFNINPTLTKSVSGNEVPVNPIELIIGYIKAGPTAISIPVIKPPAIAPFHPPEALPNTPAVAPIKK